MIAGLGNPGSQYQSTRHNIGFRVLDALAARHGGSWRHSERFNAAFSRIAIDSNPLLLIKPLSYMNRSGAVLARLCAYHKVSVEELLVVYDEVNLNLGRAKLSLSGSSGGHNGVADILARVGNGFARYRLGIGPKAPAYLALDDFVLGPFTPDQGILVEQCLPSWLDSLEYIVDKGPVLAMNTLNRQTEKTKDKEEQD